VLRPQDTATRGRKGLDGLWRFALDPAGEGRDAPQSKSAVHALRRRWRKDV